MLKKSLQSLLTLTIAWGIARSSRSGIKSDFRLICGYFFVTGNHNKNYCPPQLSIIENYAIMEPTSIDLYSNNLVKNKITCVSLFQITLYEDFWCMCIKLNQSKFFSQTSPSGFFILFHLKTLFHSI
jgi:hypothetical protein